MGLFSWLFGKSARVTVRDLIWLSNEARNNGIARRIKGSMVEMQSLLVVAHFPATLSAFVERAISHEWPCLAVQDVLTPTAALRVGDRVRPAALPPGSRTQCPGA